MADTQYGIRKAEFVLPVRDLLSVPDKTGELVFGYPVFGPNTYLNNLSEMQGTYFHSGKYPRITFREPITAESILACAYDFEKLAKPEILDLRWLQLGRIVRTQKGVFANPPKDKDGKSIVDEELLMSWRDSKSKEVRGIYLGENGFGFAAYNTFQQGVQNCDTFARGGLARVLEHTEEEVARNLREIASPKFYKSEVNVFGFDSVSEPVLRVASLFSGRDVERGRLYLCGDNWDDSFNFGCVFGVLDSAFYV